MSTREVRMLWQAKRDVSGHLHCTVEFYSSCNVILLFYRIIECVTSAVRTKYGEHYYDYNGKACEILEIADECLESINENCATDAFFSTSLSALQDKCDQEIEPHEWL